MKEEYNIINIAYDLLASNPIAGAYEMKGGEQRYITDMIDRVDEEAQVIYLTSPATGKGYRLQLVCDYAPAPGSAAQ